VGLTRPPLMRNKSVKNKDFCRYVGISGLLKTWTPSALLAAACLYFFGVFWLIAWLGLLSSTCLALFIITNFMAQDTPTVYRAVSV